MCRGATFVIMNKAKGWYVVQKDLEGLGNVVYDTSKTGWVPAGTSPYSALFGYSQPLRRTV